MRLSDGGVYFIRRFSSSRAYVRRCRSGLMSFLRPGSRRLFQSHHPATRELGGWCSIVLATDGGLDSVTGWDRVREDSSMRLFLTAGGVFQFSLFAVIGLTND